MVPIPIMIEAKPPIYEIADEIDLGV